MMTLRDVTDKTSRGDGRQLFNFHKIYNSVEGGIKTLSFYWLKSFLNSWCWIVNTNVVTGQALLSRRDLNPLRQLGNFNKLALRTVRPFKLHDPEVDRYMDNIYWKTHGCTWLDCITMSQHACDWFPKKYET